MTQCFYLYFSPYNIIGSQMNLKQIYKQTVIIDRKRKINYEHFMASWVIKAAEHAQRNSISIHPDPNAQA
jgi:hypothetical protein